MPGRGAGSSRRSDARDALSRAKELVDNYGHMAPSHAARRALELVAAGDREGYRAWLRILNEVDTLLETKARRSS